jgi:hypothetical protein
MICGKTNIYTNKALPASKNVRFKGEITKVSQHFSTLSESKHKNDVHEKKVGKHSKWKKYFIDCNYWYGIYVLLVIAVTVLSSCFLTVMPQHNVIKQPEYWYELILVYVFGWWSFSIINRVLESEMVLGYTWENKLEVMLDLFLTCAIAQAILIILLSLIWSQGLGFNCPVPFIGYSGYIVYPISCARFWYKFLLDQRTDPDFRNRLKSYFYYIGWIFFISAQTQILIKIFDTVNFDLQWALAFLVPLVKEINTYVTEKFISKAAGVENSTAKVTANIQVTCEFSFMMAIFFATTATEMTCYFMLAISFLGQIYLCFKKIKLNKRISTSNIGKQQLSQEAE